MFILFNDETHTKAPLYFCLASSGTEQQIYPI